MVSADDLGDYPDWVAGIAERKIQEAREEGLFDNLPGAGKPIDLSVNPFEQPGMGAVNRLLKHNKALPTWLLLEREIESARELVTSTLAKWELREPGLRETSDYAKARSQTREAYAKALKATNDLILKYNVTNPFAFRAPIPFMVQARLREFDACYGEGDGH